MSTVVTTALMQQDLAVGRALEFAKEIGEYEHIFMT
jgi:hypothetical protein